MKNMRIIGAVMVAVINLAGAAAASEKLSFEEQLSAVKAGALNLKAETAAKGTLRAEKEDIDQFFCDAVWNGDIPLAKEKLKAGANINAKHPYFGLTTLSLAMISAHLDMFKFLLANGADVNLRNTDGASQLHVAAYWVDGWDVVNLLVGKGAALNAKDADGQTPLHIAAKYDKRANAKALMLKGADAAITNNNGKTAVQIAEALGYKEIAAIITNTVPAR